MVSGVRRVLFPILVALVSCGPPHGFYLRYGNQLTESDLAQVLKESPLGPKDNIKIVTLGQGGTVSHHIVQIRDREVPHVHKNHDLTVVVLRGKGPIVIDQEQRFLGAGDVVFIPRDTVHYFTNASRDPAVALVVFSPPFDGKDTVPVTTP
jgi:mannose-6-phosphate isomerase-like protein (cupin superfamily)